MVGSAGCAGTWDTKGPFTAYMVSNRRIARPDDVLLVALFELLDCPYIANAGIDSIDNINRVVRFLNMMFLPLTG